MSPGMLADSRIITKSLSDHSSGIGGTPTFGLVPPYSLFFGVPFERVLIQGYKPSFRSHAIRSRDWDSAADLVSTTLLKLLDPFKTSVTWSSTKGPPTTAEVLAYLREDSNTTFSIWVGRDRVDIYTLLAYHLSYTLMAYKSPYGVRRSTGFFAASVGLPE
jgi:hypothetical protein